MGYANLSYYIWMASEKVQVKPILGPSLEGPKVRPVENFNASKSWFFFHLLARFLTLRSGVSPKRVYKWWLLYLNFSYLCIICQCNQIEHWSWLNIQSSSLFFLAPFNKGKGKRKGSGKGSKGKREWKLGRE